MTPTAMAMKSVRIAQWSDTKIAQLSRVTQSAVIETTFTLRGIALCLRKLDMYPPSFGWFISQSYSFRFPRRNKAAANNSRGVVGSTGRNAPNTPNPSDIRPNMVKIIFTVYLLPPPRRSFMPPSDPRTEVASYGR